MPVTNQQAAVLRAMLSGDIAEHRRLREQLDPRADQRPYAVLVSNAFIEAADRRFGSAATSEDVIAFVADVRAWADSVREGLDPAVAERVLLAAVGVGDVRGLDARTVRTGQAVLLTAMITDAGLEQAELDEFMTRVRAQADDQLARRPR
jgi:hypothetical protein